MAVSQKPIILDETGQKIASNIATHTTKIEELINKHNKVFVGEGAGLVPASETGEVSKFLRSDGHWVSLDGFSTVTTLPSSATTQQPILLHSIAQAGSSSTIEEVLFVSGVNVVPSTKSLNVGGTTTTNALSVTNNTTTKTLTSSGITNTGSISQNGNITVTGSVYASGDAEFGGTVSSLAVSTGNISATKVTSLGEVIGNTHVRVAASNGIPDLIIRNDGSSVYFLLSDYANGSWNSLRPLTINIASGNLSTSGAITASGGITASGNITGAKVFNAVWNDYAEFFPRGEETEAGDFVALSLDSDEEVYVKASKETSKSVGIHSDSFGHLIGGENVPEGEDFVEYNLPKFIPVGLAGRCYAKVVGCVKKGDFIVISDIPGVGRAFDKSVDSVIDIIGMACETSESEEIKLVKVKVGN